MAAAREAVNQQERSPLQKFQVSGAVTTRLPHLPYKSWCPTCLAHRGRSHKHGRSGKSHSGPVPTISFHFFFTKSDGKDAKGDELNNITLLYPRQLGRYRNEMLEQTTLVFPDE